MKQKMHWLRTLSTGTFLTLIVLTCFMPGQAQTVPQACIQSNPKTTTVTLGSPAAAGANILPFQLEPDWASLIVNPGGATEERIPIARRIGGSTPLGAQGAQTQLLYAHSAGETILVINELEVVFGYTNTSNVTQSIPRGVSSHNYFSPGSLVYSQQTTQYLPGVHGNAFTIKFGTDIPAGFFWFLNTTQLDVTSATPRCATITYQGRLSDSGNIANGNYDLQFEAYDTATNGTAQTDRIKVSNVAVTNGIFTVPLFFAHTFTNINARFFEIGVRPGGSSGAFTILAPRQPITDVPFAVNAHTAFSIACRTGFTSFASGRLCVSARQPAAPFYGTTGAIQTCKNMQARVGGSADVMLTFSVSSFNYFDGAGQGWLADHFGDNTWGTWNTSSVTPDFDGLGLNVVSGGSGGTAPSLPYRCVY